MTSAAWILAIALAGWAGTAERAEGAPAQPRQADSVKSFFNRKPFSADMVIRPGREGAEEHQGKIYATANAMRMDMQIQEGIQSSVIVRYDKKVVWILLPGQSKYMEMPLSPRAGMISALRDNDAQVEKEDLGAEKAGEYECEKYRVKTTSQGHEYTGLVWIAKSGDVDGFVVKTQDVRTGATTEFRNIKPEEPDASEFEVPAGYQKMEMPAMPGMPHE